VALDPSNSSNLEQLVLKGLILDGMAQKPTYNDHFIESTFKYKQHDTLIYKRYSVYEIDGILAD